MTEELPVDSALAAAALVDSALVDSLQVYSVWVSREDDLWVAVVEGLPAGATDVERFAELPEAVRDLVGTLLDVEPDGFWLDWHYQVAGHDLTTPIGHIRQWDELADGATRNRDATRRAAVRSMHAAGLSYREIADVIGLSHQRVGQLLADSVPVDTVFVPDRFAVRLRAVTGHDRPVDADAPAASASPLEVVVGTVLDLVRRVRPEARAGLLAAAAEVLGEAAKDPDFLMSR